jgi:hypothetical protein
MSAQNCLKPGMVVRSKLSKTLGIVSGNKSKLTFLFPMSESKNYPSSICYPGDMEFLKEEIKWVSNPHMDLIKEGSVLMCEFEPMEKQWFGIVREIKVIQQGTVKCKDATTKSFCKAEMTVNWGDGEILAHRSSCKGIFNYFSLGTFPQVKDETTPKLRTENSDESEEERIPTPKEFCVRFQEQRRVEANKKEKAIDSIRKKLSIRFQNEIAKLLTMDAGRSSGRISLDFVAVEDLNDDIDFLRKCFEDIIPSYTDLCDVKNIYWQQSPSCDKIYVVSADVYFH